MNPPLQGGDLSTFSLTQDFILGWQKPSLQDEEHDAINALFTA
ncbi:hypothetical protein [Lacunimicrobium album]